MLVYIVYESDYDHYLQHGIFSEREQAQAYIAMVQTSEASGVANAKVYGSLDIRVVELDALVGAAPIFTAYSKDESSSVDVFYGHLPQPPVLLRLDDPSLSFEAYGLTPAEARDNYLGS